LSLSIINRKMTLAVAERRPAPDGYDDQIGSAKHSAIIADSAEADFDVIRKAIPIGLLKYNPDRANK
jgi:hypothetical protein